MVPPSLWKKALRPLGGSCDYKEWKEERESG